jgi:hypothetical protein
MTHFRPAGTLPRPDDLVRLEWCYSCDNRSHLHMHQVRVHPPHVPGEETVGGRRTTPPPKEI